MTPAASGYRYFGVLIGKVKAVVALVSVILLPTHSHAAVWLGASSPNAHRWVQAGIEQQTGDAHPYAYIEIGRQGRQVSLWEWPVSPSDHLRVRLFHRGSRWRVVIGGHSSRFVYVPHASTITTLETQGDLPVAVVAYIDGRLVSST